MTENKRFDSIYYEEFCRVITDNGKEINPLEVVDLLNEQDAEIKRLECINRQLEERLDRSIALDMSRCGKYVYGVHGGSND